MNDVRFAPVDAPERETLREPAKRWRNKWRAEFFNVCERCRVFHHAGEIYWDCCDPVWPSRDAAESSAAEQVAYQIANEGVTLEEHLGAFPVDGEAP